MPWKGVTVSEQRERFLEDYRAELLLASANWPSDSRSRERQPTSGSTGFRNTVTTATMSNPVGRTAAPGRRSRRSSRSWWACARLIRTGARGSCWT